jgi:serine/threonine protein kinase
MEVNSISAFLIDVSKQGYIAIDFYDGSIMYDLQNKVTTICDIDFFRESPSQNDMGQMWGSSRFMSPEEYELGLRWMRLQMCLLWAKWDSLFLQIAIETSQRGLYQRKAIMF